ncbi:hypothetical protein LY76DRAFT_352991 [Colletotrichum caudatum]|nr:hypothetical protein LY76DRAFT_352991 [Colletotrichum caudatum]
MTRLAKTPDPVPVSCTDAESPRRGKQKEKRRNQNPRPTTPTGKAGARMTSARYAGVTHDSGPEPEPEPEPEHRPWQAISADTKTLPDIIVMLPGFIHCDTASSHSAHQPASQYRPEKRKKKKNRFACPDYASCEMNRGNHEIPDLPIPSRDTVLSGSRPAGGGGKGRGVGYLK